MVIYRVGFLTALALVAAMSAARAQAEHTIVSLPAENLGFIPFYVAQDTHIFEKQGLDVQKVVLAGVGTTNGVISGSVDFGFSNGASLTRAASKGQKMLGIALMSDKPAWALLVDRKIAEDAHFDPNAPLAERAKVMGKIHAFGIDTVNSVGHGLTRVVEMAGGIDPESIPVSPVSSADAVAALSRHSLDGFVGSPPWTQQTLAGGNAVVIADALKGDPSWLTPFGSGLVITRPQFCVDHHSICVKMGHSLVEAAKFVHEHKPESLAIMKAHFDKLAPAVVEDSFAVIEKAMPATPVIVEAAVRNSDRLNVEAGFMKASEQLPDYKELFTDEYVR